MYANWEESDPDCVIELPGPIDMQVTTPSIAEDGILSPAMKFTLHPSIPARDEITASAVRQLDRLLTDEGGKSCRPK